jgi:hypothetical protein
MTPLPPLLYAPIYNLSVGELVYVSGILPNSEVSISATPANQPNGLSSVVGHTTSSGGGDVWVKLSVALTGEQTVTATQTNAGTASGVSNAVVTQVRPKRLPPLAFLSTLSTCMGALRIGGLIEGCTLHITNAGSSVLEKVATQPILSVQSFAIPTSVTFAPGAVLEAWQSFGETKSNKTTSAAIVSSASLPLRTPAITTPVWPCQTAITLSNLTEGTQVTIINPAPEGTGSVFSDTFAKVEVNLVAPLQQGELTAQQAFNRCPQIAPSPIGSVQVPAPHPLPTPGILFAPFTGYEQLIVSNVVPGETLSISTVTEGGVVQQVLGEQPVTWVPATVNLPPYSSTDPSGNPVSLQVTGTLCTNAAATASIVAPVTPPASFGGNNQYIFWGGLGTEDRPIPIQGLEIEIVVIEDIIVSPNSGVTPQTPNPLPISFQINGLPPARDVQRGQTTRDWKPTAGDQAIGAVQYGVKMWPNQPTLTSFAEYWPSTVEANSNVTNTFNLSTPTPVTLPNNLTIPAGWTIRFKFNQESDGTIIGFDCKVIETATGAVVLPDMGINFLDAPNQLAAGGPIKLANLSQLVAFEVEFVGFWSSANATLLSGGGTITCKARTPMTVQTGWPADSPDYLGNLDTVEDANTTYGLLPPGPSKSFTQTFGVS